MLDSGYVRLYRSFTKWEWYDDTNTKSVFLHLILTANYEPKKWHGITVQRGQRICSYGILSKELKISEKSVRTAINHLKQTGEVAHSATAKYGLFTVLNYDKFQDGAPEQAQFGQTIGTQAAPEGQQLKKDKESNKARKIIYSDYRDAFLKFCPSLPKPEDAENWSDRRKKWIRDKKMTFEEMGAVFERVEKSDFLSGRNGKWSGCAFDWILKPENWKKIIEGNYDNRGPAKPEHKPSYDIEEYEKSDVFGNFDRK